MSDEIGPTGELSEVWPLAADDEGGLRFMVTNHQGRVILDFGASVAWLGLDPDQADALADGLREEAAKLKV